MDKRGGLAKQLRSPLNMISRDDFLHDNDSSNDSAAVTKGLKSLIKEQSQSTLGIFFFFLLLLICLHRAEMTHTFTLVKFREHRYLCALYSEK